VRFNCSIRKLIRKGKFPTIFWASFGQQGSRSLSIKGLGIFLVFLLFFVYSFILFMFSFQVLLYISFSQERTNSRISCFNRHKFHWLIYLWCNLYPRLCLVDCANKRYKKNSRSFCSVLRRVCQRSSVTALSLFFGQHHTEIVLSNLYSGRKLRLEL